MNADLSSRFFAPPPGSGRPAAPDVTGVVPMTPADDAGESEHFDVRSDLALLGRVLKRTKGLKLIVMIFAGWIVATVALMVGHVRYNKWYGQFFDAIEKKNISDFTTAVLIFLPIVAVMLSITVGQTFLQERLKFRFREWVSKHLLDAWLVPLKVYRLNFAGKDARNPDQRIQEDTRLVGEATTALACGAISSLMQFVAFVGVLWGLSSQVTFPIGGQHIAIPGYMVWCAIAYAVIGSGLTYLVGRPLIALNTERYAREAAFRFALVRVNESSECIALHKGESDEKRQLELSLAAVIESMRRISGSIARLTFITSGTGWLSIVVPMLVAAPAYFSGNLTLGSLMMVTGAFSQVQGSLRWFVDNFANLADWRSGVHRIARFRAAIEDMPEVDEPADNITRVEHPKGHLAFEGVRILLPDGECIIDEASATITPGERVLIVGDSGVGKSTLFRAIAGIWPWGGGKISAPPCEDMAFLPQRPYMPLGTLRYALTYPAAADSYSDAHIRRALERCGLGQFAQSLDQQRRWDKALSLGEQQRLAFARLLLLKPRWVFLDEATSALDSDSQHRVLSLFDNELKASTLLSIGHRPDLATYHTRTLQLVHDHDGARLKIKQRSATLPRWRRRAEGSNNRPGKSRPPGAASPSRPAGTPAPQPVLQ